jgi:membrane protein DedA with SNARE-associated domain
VNWRQYFGINPALEAQQPGHTVGVALLLAVMVGCALAYLYGAFAGRN